MQQHGNVTAWKRRNRLLVYGCVVLLSLMVYLSVTSSWKNLRLTITLTAVVKKVTFTSNESASVPSNLSDGLTVVTAFFDIGAFQKGNSGSQFTPRLYKDWARVFARLESPTIIFVDSEEFRRYFAELRALHLRANLTVIRLLDRRQMWSFQLVPSIVRIFSRPHYPVHMPNTVVANYSAAMHAKYEVMQMAIHSNPFNTRYFCWLDIGLFRDLSGAGVNAARFALSLPPKFDTDCVAYTEVTRRLPELSVQDIVSRNLYWVCGCFFVGRIDVLQLFIEEYKAATERMIRDGWVSTDQQVLYAMYNSMSPRTRLQLYHSDGRYNDWFHLGYVARDASTARSR